jgi:hypothetical protein
MSKITTFIKVLPSTSNAPKNVGLIIVIEVVDIVETTVMVDSIIVNNCSLDYNYKDIIPIIKRDDVEGKKLPKHVTRFCFLLRPVIGFCITKTCYFFSLQKFSIEFHG